MTNFSRRFWLVILIFCIAVLFGFYRLGYLTGFDVLEIVAISAISILFLQLVSVPVKLLSEQLWLALRIFVFIVAVGIIGFQKLEKLKFLDAIYATVITVSTVGYGDLSPITLEGKILAIFLAIFSLAAIAIASQALVQIAASPIIRERRQRRQIKKQVDQLRHHYIICGMGEMVDKTVKYLLQGATARRDTLRTIRYTPIDNFLDKVFGDDDIEDARHLWFRRPIRRLIHWAIDYSQNETTLLDIVVVITQDKDYAERLRDNGMLVIVGDPTDDDILEEAGIQRAQAMMVLLDNDTETLMTVLTVHTLVPTLHITAAVLDDDLSKKMIRAGANAVLTPYDTAGQFLNNATLRPAVNAFFNGLMFDFETDHRIIQLEMWDDSPWIGKTIGELKLRHYYNAGVIGIRHIDARYSYGSNDYHVIEEDETLIIVAPDKQVEILRKACRGDTKVKPRLALWQPLPTQQPLIKSDKTYALMEAEEAIKSMEKHFIICGNDRVAHSSIARLDPERPFVIISNDSSMGELVKRGFRVVHGNPTSEDVLLRAGIKRAQAIMVALENEADSVLTILSSRTLNKQLLITTTANSDDMVDKLERAGADVVVSPFNVAARFILLTTTRPKISAFVNYVLYSYQTSLETTEIYVEDDSEWIGKTISELKLGKTYNAGVIGVRLANRSSFIYAPSSDYVVREKEVLIIVTPMKHSDAIRDAAHGGKGHQPSTLRAKVLQSQKWSQEEIAAMLKEAEKSK